MIDPKETLRAVIVRATVDKYSGKTGAGGEGISEYFVNGTVQGGAEDFHRECTICAETGYLATPDCPHTATKNGIVRPGFSLDQEGVSCGV